MTALVRKSEKKNQLYRAGLAAACHSALTWERSCGKLEPLFQHYFKRWCWTDGAAALLDLQRSLSHVPKENELLIEHIATEDGYHLFVYPFEGRLVHAAMAAILAYRISRIQPITFSFAMNDCRFELLSDQPIPVDDSNVYELFSPDDLLNDIQRSVNSTEMAEKIQGMIGGLHLPGYAGWKKKAVTYSLLPLCCLMSSANTTPTYCCCIVVPGALDQQMEEAMAAGYAGRIQAVSHNNYHSGKTPFCFPDKSGQYAGRPFGKAGRPGKKMQQQMEQ